MSIIYHEIIPLIDYHSFIMSKVVNMTEVGFSRFMKINCENLHWQSQQHLIGARLSAFNRHTLTITGVSFWCRFNNLSYFNRLFKKNTNALLKNFVRIIHEPEPLFSVIVLFGVILHN